MKSVWVLLVTFYSTVELSCHQFILGVFDSPEEADMAYNQFADKFLEYLDSSKSEYSMAPHMYEATAGAIHAGAIADIADFLEVPEEKR